MNRVRRGLVWKTVKVHENGCFVEGATSCVYLYVATRDLAFEQLKKFESKRSPVLMC